MVASHPPKKIVVAHVILSLEIGGMEQVVVDLVKAIDRNRFEPVVICLMRLGPLGEELKALGVSVHLLPPLKPIVSFIYPAPLVNILKQVGAEVVHIHSGCWFKGALAAKFCGVKKIIYTLHGATYARAGILKLLERIAARFTSNIVVVSHDLYSQVRCAGHISMQKVLVVINGINAEKFMAISVKVSHGPVRIGVIARLEPVKNLGTLLRAMNILRDEGADVTLDLIGDGSERTNLQQLALELGISDRVQFLGFQRDTPQRLAAMDIFANCSLSEGTSISILEAMAAGIPVVATAVGGNPALVEDGVNGYLVPASDPLAFAQALSRLVLDEGLRVRMGGANRIKVQREFSVESMTRQYEELYAG